MKVYYLEKIMNKIFCLIKNKTRNRVSIYKNVTIQKRKQQVPITSEKRLNDLPSVYTEIPADQTDKTEATKKVF